MEFNEQMEQRWYELLYKQDCTPEELQEWERLSDLARQQEEIACQQEQQRETTYNLSQLKW